MKFEKRIVPIPIHFNEDEMGAILAGRDEKNESQDSFLHFNPGAFS
jgi:hypothetical protein